MEKKEGLPRFHDGFFWTSYYKLSVWEDYHSGEHYKRVKRRRIRTIRRLKSEIRDYKNKEEQITKTLQELSEKEETFSEREKVIREREKNYEEMELNLKRYQEQLSQQAEKIGKLTLDNEELQEKVSQLETKIKDYYERKIAFDRQVIRKLKENQLLVVIEEVEANIGRKDLVAVVNDKDEVVYASDRLIAQLGYNKEEVRGQDYHRFLEKPSDEFLAGREEQGILNLKGAKGEPLLVKVSRTLYRNPVEVNEHEIDIYSGAKVKFEVVGWWEKRRINKKLEEEKELRDKAKKLAEETRRMAIEEYGINPEELESQDESKPNS